MPAEGSPKEPGGQPGPRAQSQTAARGSWRVHIGAAARARSIPLGTILTTVLVAFAVLDLNALMILVLWVLRTVVLYVIVATFVALVLSPPVHFLERRGLRRGAAATVVFVLGVLAFGGLVYIFSAPLVSAVRHFAAELPDLVRQAETGRGRLGHLIQQFHLQRWVNDNAPKLAADIATSVKPAQALSVGAAALSTVVGLTTIAMLSFFLLLEMPAIGRGVLGLFRPDDAERLARVYLQVSRAVTGYILGNFLTSLCAGLVVLVTLVGLGIPFALLLAVWVALVDLLPLVGGLLAGVPVVVIALLHSVVDGVITLVVFLVYQQVENHILNPLIMSRTVRLNPLWVFLAVLVGATLGHRVGAGLGSFAGALIGIPVGGALQVVVHEIRQGPTAYANAGAGSSSGTTTTLGPGSLHADPGPDGEG